MKKHLLLSILVLSSFLMKAQVPEYYNTSVSSVINNYPLSSNSFNKAQWIFPAGEFNAGGTGIGAAPYVGNISKIFLRMGNSVSFNPYSNFTISLTQNLSGMTSFGTTAPIAYSFVTGLTPCFYQASGFSFVGATPNSWYGIQLNTSFQYDPALPLLVEIKVSGGSGNSISLTNTSTPRRLYGGYSASSATNATGVLNFGFNMIQTPLPVQLFSFNGHQNGSADICNWTTNSETNNAFFSLQHSTDGINFVTIQKVNTKASNGNSSTSLNYEGVNNMPSLGHNYYRLAQVDINGTTSLNSHIIDLFRTSDGNQVSVYPNPTTDLVNVDFFVNKTSNILIKLVDINGRIIKQVKNVANEGANHIPIQLSEFSKGLYMIHLIENDKLVSTHKITKE